MNFINFYHFLYNIVENIFIFDFDEQSNLRVIIFYYLYQTEF